ncbi:hypothetical protein FRB90_007622 [Tulasnella sp. 427]|nr:hypothetical protein FRB90_007622 [Tulasnella sp. 427]
MFFGQRPVSMFPTYNHRPEYHQPSVEEQYYRQLAEEENRRADAALRRAQQERAERAAREREIQALREREYREEQARRARLHQQARNRRPQSFFGTPEFESPFDFFGGPFGGPNPRARAAEEQRRRRQSHPEDAENRRFSTFLDDLFGRRGEEDDEDVPAARSVSDPRSCDDSYLHPNFDFKQARFGTPPRAQPQPQPTAAETRARSPSPQPVPSTLSSPSTKPTEASAPSSPKTHSTSFSLLDAIQTQFDALKSGFTFPANVEFQSTESPKLTYSSVNAPVHQYENELIKLLTKLDAVESDGAASVRGARKALVIAVEKELDRLEEQKRDAWRKTLPDETAEVPIESEESEFAPIEDEPTATELPATQDSIAMELSQQALDAASIPLPHSDDMELDVSPESVATAAEVSVPLDPTVGQSLGEEASATQEEIASSLSSRLLPETSEAIAEDLASERGSEEPSEDAAVLLDAESGSDSKVEVFIQVEEPSPRISEAVLEGENDVVVPQEETASGAKALEVEDEDDFEMV